MFTPLLVPSILVFELLLKPYYWVTFRDYFTFFILLSLCRTSGRYIRGGCLIRMNRKHIHRYSEGRRGHVTLRMVSLGKSTFHDTLFSLVTCLTGVSVREFERATCRPLSITTWYHPRLQFVYGRRLVSHSSPGSCKSYPVIWDSLDPVPFVSSTGLTHGVSCSIDS